MPATAQDTYAIATNRLDPVLKAEEAILININIVPSQMLARGTVMGELTATPGTFKPYASGNVDGSQIPKGVLQYALTTDGGGNITIANEFGIAQKAAPMYVSGIFKTTDLAGLDANAVAVLQGRYVTGVLADGILAFGA